MLQQTIDQVLADGGSRRDSRYRIVAHLKKDCFNIRQSACRGHSPVDSICSSSIEMEKDHDCIDGAWAS